MIEDFLARRAQLANTALLANQILKSMYARMGAELPQDISRPEGQLYALLAGIRERAHLNENNHQQ